MFDNQDKLNVAYRETSNDVRVFLDSNFISQYLREALSQYTLTAEQIRQLILFCRLKIANQATDDELNVFIKNENLNEQIKAEISICLNTFISDDNLKKYSPQISLESRTKSHAQANPVKNYLTSSTSSKIALVKILKKHNLVSKETIKGLLVTVNDIVLGFYKIEDTVPLIQQELGLDAKTAALLGADVLDFLAPLSDPNWQPPIEQDSELVGETTQPNVTTNELLPQAPSNEPISLVATEIPALRTMAADMIEGRSPVRNTFNAASAIDEPVYVSSQPTIEKSAPPAPSYTAPLYQPPKPNVDAPLEKPRWG